MMSDTTPDPASADTGEQRATPVEPATGAAASAAAEVHDTDPEVVDPPSSPVSARGHVNRPAAETADTAAADSARNTAPAPAVTPAPAAQAPAAVTEPEPVVSTEDDIAAAVARTAAQPGEAGATAAGSATVDTASPSEAAAPVVAAAAAAGAQTAPAATAAYGTAAGAQTAPAATAAYGTAPVAGTGWAPEQAAPVQPQPVAPIFLQRPEPPKRKSNRGTGILIVLVGTVAFALLWSVAVVVVGALLTPSNEYLQALLEYYTQQISGWVPVVAFFVGMVVLVQIVNRSRWWAYILGGLVVAVFVYFTYVGAYLVDAHYWERTPGEFAILLRSAWLNPFAVLAGVIAREISVWTGAWLAARGRKLKARNAEAQADYEQQVADAQNQAVAAYATQQGY